MAAKKKKPNEKDTGISGSTRSMRDEAEKEIARTSKISPALAGQTPEELIHELRVHQIELEMQAEELRIAHLALEESRDKYLDLYEFAPIGYLTLTDTALIADVNLTGARLIGLSRSKLKQARFRKLVAPRDLDAWDQYFMCVLQHEQTLPITLLLKRGDDTVFPVRLESIRLSGKSDGTTIVRVAISDMTEISRAEEAKRETSAWLRFALHSAKAGIWDWNFPTGKLVWSPEFFLLFGLPPDAPPSFETWLAVLHPDDRTSAMEKINQSVKEHRDLWNEYRILLPDGDWRWIGTTGSTSYNDSGEPLRMSGVCIDITERKLAEEALREEEARLSLALDVGKAGVWEWNLETDTVYFDARFHALLGYDPGELPTTLAEWMHYHNQEDVPVWMGKAQAYLLGDSPVYESEHRIHTKSGDWAWIFTRGRLMTRTTTGSQKLFIGFAMNVTDRKKADDAFRESENKYRSLFEHMAAGSCVDEIIYEGGKAVDYRVLDVNSAYEEILGIRKSQAIGALASQIYGTGEAPFLDVYSKVAETGTPVTFEAWFEPSRKHVQITVACPAKGRVSSVFTDITQRKQEEEEITRSFERFKTVMDGLDVLVYVVDRETYKLLFINKYVKDHWGEIEGQTCWRTIQSGQSGPCPFCTNDKLVDSNGNPTGVYHWEFQNPVTRKWYDCRDSAIRWLDGRLVRLEIATDITERKRAEEALRESERELKLLFMRMINAFVLFKTVFDDNGNVVSFRFVFINDAYERITGVKNDEVRGKTMHEVWPGTEASWIKAYGDVAVTGVPNSFEMYHEPTKKLYYCNVYRPGDSQDSICVIFEDITDRKHAADMLALTTRKLTLMNDVTYQYIQNKITAIRGYAELSKDVKTQSEWLSFIEKEEHILADIHQLIKNSKEYQAMGLVQPRWIPGEQSIRIAVSLVSPNPDISVETAVPGLELYTDPLIEKIFANLIENAVIHGKTTRSIRFSYERKADELILICEDDGVGISPEVKAHIFNRGFSGNARFGLFFISECIALFGMTIAETGEPGKGARFEITVPKGMYRFGRPKG
jgi:PAS domain S-box-containing protein